MIRWFQPKCPIDPVGKVWVEGRLSWLSAHFGDKFFLERPPVLPTREYFPELFDPNGATVQSLFNRVCYWMDVDPDRIEIELVPQQRYFGLVNQDGHAVSVAAGRYQGGQGKDRVELSTSQLAFPLVLIGTIAHELSHFKLLGGGYLRRDTLDDELSTDLCVVHHGLGIFLANAPRAWRYNCTTWPNSTLIMPKYMTASMYGWSLAHQAWLRKELDPKWFTFLTGDAKSCAWRGLRYLARTQDSAWHVRDWRTWEQLEHALLPAQADATHPVVSAAEQLVSDAEGLIELDQTKAETMLREALTLDPTCGAAYNNLGTMLAQQNKIDEAVIAFEQASKFMPGHPDPHFNLALMMERTGRDREAAQSYEAALRVSAEYLPAIAGLASVIVRTQREDPRLEAWLERIAVEGEDATLRAWASAHQTGRGEK